MTRHGGPEDRGRADAYYRRPFEPHFYEGGTYMSRRVGREEMTPEQEREYARGFAEGEASGDFKQWE